MKIASFIHRLQVNISKILMDEIIMVENTFINIGEKMA
jgi:hypothetical protein